MPCLGCNLVAQWYNNQLITLRSRVHWHQERDINKNLNPPPGLYPSGTVEEHLIDTLRSRVRHWYRERDSDEKVSGFQTGGEKIIFWISPISSFPCDVYRSLAITVTESRWQLYKSFLPCSVSLCINKLVRFHLKNTLESSLTFER
jgi:hypothetical protein